MSVGNSIHLQSDNAERRDVARALEDCLLYYLPSGFIDALNAEKEHVLAFYNASEQERLRKTMSSRDTNVCLTQSIDSLMSHSPVCCDSWDSIQVAAQRMSNAKVSSICVLNEGSLQGILTDRDIRSRVVAGNVDIQKTVSAVMTTNPVVVTPSCSVYDAQLVMMHENIHHLPVVLNDELVGVVTVNDFVRAQNAEPIYLIKAINRAPDTQALVQSCRVLPELIDNLIRANVRALDIGRVITSVTDALTRRLLFLAHERFGALPCAYAWVVFGSQARADQMLGSDQDNGLILERVVSEEEREMFEVFARFVNDGLDACGLVYCPGGIMAMNEKWCQPLTHWNRYFDQWIHEPEPKALMHASIFYDIRHVAGEASLTQTLKEHVGVEAQKNSIFHAAMLVDALQSSPPLGFFKQFVLERVGIEMCLI